MKIDFDDIWWLINKYNYKTRKRHGTSSAHANSYSGNIIYLTNEKSDSFQFDIDTGQVLLVSVQYYTKKFSYERIRVY